MTECHRTVVVRSIEGMSKPFVRFMDHPRGTVMQIHLQQATMRTTQIKRPEFLPVGERCPVITGNFDTDQTRTFAVCYPGAIANPFLRYRIDRMFAVIIQTDTT